MPETGNRSNPSFTTVSTPCLPCVSATLLSIWDLGWGNKQVRTGDREGGLGALVLEGVSGDERSSPTCHHPVSLSTSEALHGMAPLYPSPGPSPYPTITCKQLTARQLLSPAVTSSSFLPLGFCPCFLSAVASSAFHSVCKSRTRF